MANRREFIQLTVKGKEVCAKIKKVNIYWFTGIEQNLLREPFFFCFGICLDCKLIITCHQQFQLLG
jgi:hypothetical protein